MSGLAVLVLGGFTALSLWGLYLGIQGCVTDHAPFMKGEGKQARFDSRMKKAA